jgi:hypothetical protein
MLHEAGRCIQARKQDQRAAHHQHPHLIAGFRPERRRFLRTLFGRGQFHHLGLRLGRRDGGNLGRWRRIGDRPFMRDRCTPDHIIFHVVVDDAIFLWCKIGQHVTDIVGIKRG